MSTNASAYKAVALAKMPYKVLTKNCAAVQSALNGNNGNLGLTMPVAQCTTRTGGVAYVDSPNHPGAYDATIANNAEQVILSHREAEHKQQVDNHMIKKTVENIIKIMLDEAFSRWLLAEIEDREIGLNTMSIHNTLDNTFDCRGQIDDDLVDEYTNTYNSPIDMFKGFNVYVERQEECHDF
eukprot:4554710-Ditylum_brightwellii.AAC.1